MFDILQKSTDSRTAIFAVYRVLADLLSSAKLAKTTQDGGSTAGSAEAFDLSEKLLQQIRGGEGRERPLSPAEIKDVVGQLLSALNSRIETAPKANGAELVASLRSNFPAPLSPEIQRRGDAADEDATRLRDQPQENILRLQPEVDISVGPDSIVGRSPALQPVLARVARVARTDSIVLITGETGTGKELVARAIHRRSARASRAFVSVNCAAVPRELIASELFGHEKGAFTGATQRRLGRFELAHGGTIFLDEVGELPMETQVALLRVLQEREFERVGGSASVRVDVRVMAATNRDLQAAIDAGTFRNDLFYRLNVFPIRLPPLRESREDIPLLVWHFVHEYSKAFGKKIDTIAPETFTAMQQYPWPGNVRELRNVVEHAMIVATTSKLSIPLPASIADVGARSVRLADIQKEHIRQVLDSAGWRIRGSGGAADRLGLRPETLETRMAKLGLTRPRHPAGQDSTTRDDRTPAEDVPRTVQPKTGETG